MYSCTMYMNERASVHTLSNSHSQANETNTFFHALERVNKLEGAHSCTIHTYRKRVSQREGEIHTESPTTQQINLMNLFGILLRAPLPHRIKKPTECRGGEEERNYTRFTFVAIQTTINNFCT